MVKAEYGQEVCVIRKNWGQPGIPSGKIDYLDGVAFTGGVARNVPIVQAQLWQANQRLGVYVLPNDASEADFIKATGTQPMPAEQFASMLRGYDLAQVAQVLGEDGTLKLANELRRLIIPKGQPQKGRE